MDAGQAIYSKTCVACHGTGAGGAPVLTDATEWKARRAKGTALLYSHAINGFTGNKGMMPPRGGNASLSDADVKSAVDYILATAAK